MRGVGRGEGEGGKEGEQRPETGQGSREARPEWRQHSGASRGGDRQRKEGDGQRGPLRTS